MHTYYHQAVTATGRLSSDQCLTCKTFRYINRRRSPLSARRLLRQDYVIVSADSQIELRIMAHLCA
ncbi:DNA polymerase [Escherichia coli]